jgi:imidazolonepropionase-like amidohydrolase
MWAVKAERCFDGDRFRSDGVTVLVDAEQILGVEPLAYDVPAGTEVTSYDGTLLPGLFDCHAHLVADGSPGSLERAGGATDDELDTAISRNLAAQATGGVTTVRDLGDRRFRTLVARDRRSPGEPRIVAAGPPVTEPEGHCHFLGGAVAGVEQVREAVRDRAERGVDVIKVMVSGGMLTPGSDVLGTQLTTDELRAAVETAHDVGLPVLAHSHSLAGVRHAVSAGVDGLEHVTCLTEEGPVTPDDLLDAIAAGGITVDPTLGFDPARVLPIEQAPPAVRAMVERLGLTPVQVSQTRGDQILRARARGIRIVTGLDAGAAPPKPHGAVWRSVAQLADFGMPVAEALSTATSVAADDCGLGGTTGRLAAGHDADLLVVDGHAETDVEALGRPAAVWVRGIAVER